MVQGKLFDLSFLFSEMFVIQIFVLNLKKSFLFETPFNSTTVNKEITAIPSFNSAFYLTKIHRQKSVQLLLFYKTTDILLKK